MHIVCVRDSALLCNQFSDIPKSGQETRDKVISTKIEKIPEIK